MGYNKFILSGNQLELYEYEKECFIKGRQRGYANNSLRQDLEDSRGSTFLDRKFARRQDNSRRSSLDFKRLVQANLTASENPLLITLTFSTNRKDISECARFFHLFTIRMRRTFGSSFRYVAVPEFQKRGAVHYHALFWGLPLSVEVRERETRKIARLWGEGFIDIVKTDGNNKLATYLAKYMVKAISDRRLLFHKAYFASRNVFRPIRSSGFPSWWFSGEFPEDTLSLKFTREFSTSWLGKGLFRLYEVSPSLSTG